MTESTNQTEQSESDAAPTVPAAGLDPAHEAIGRALAPHDDQPAGDAEAAPAAPADGMGLQLVGAALATPLPGPLDGNDPGALRPLRPLPEKFYPPGYPNDTRPAYAPINKANSPAYIPPDYYNKLVANCYPLAVVSVGLSALSWFIYGIGISVGAFMLALIAWGWSTRYSKAIGVWLAISALFLAVICLTFHLLLSFDPTLGQ